MTRNDAIAWINGERTMCNVVQQEPIETWEVRIAQADAAKLEQAYWSLRAINELEKMFPKEEEHE